MEGGEDYGASWLASIEPELQLGPDGTLRYFNSAQGERIASYYWPARGQAKAVVQLVHGHGSYLCY
jgi:alpha-beta hydrolase superfamily lysophospholipase